MVGKTVGKYRILATLGRGATGIVYRALDETLDREVAIKVLSPGFARSELLKRFRAEATTLAKLHHPHVATIYELVSLDADLLMVMELVRGETLEHLADRMGAIPPDCAVSLMDQVLSGLAHTHRAGIVHRDLKPSNIMVTGSSGVKIMDFGIARVNGTEHITNGGGMLGTPAYMPPEQVVGLEVDGRADLYAVGVVLYRLLAGALPFRADNAVGMMHQQMSEAPTPLHVHREGLPAWCEPVVQRALAKAPADRFQTAEEFRDALNRAIGMSAPIDLTKALALSDGEGDRAGRHVPAPGAPGGPSEATLATEPIASLEADSASNAVPLSPSGTGSTGFRQAAIGATVVLGAPAHKWPHSISAAVAAAVVLACVALVWIVKGPAIATPKAFPVVVFQAKVLVGDGGRTHERDAQLVLADGQVSVTEEDSQRRLRAVSYGDVLSIHYSRGSDPFWNTPKGPRPVVRLPSGGFLMRIFGQSLQRDWVSLETRTEEAGTGRFIVIHVSEPQVEPVLTALEERTNRVPQRIGSRRGGG